MLVVATKKGYYKRIREPGDQFEYPIKKDQEMPSWMVAANKAKADKAKANAEAAAEAEKQAIKDAEDAAALAEAKIAEAAKAEKIAEAELADVEDIGEDEESVFD